MYRKTKPYINIDVDIYSQKISKGYSSALDKKKKKKIDYHDEMCRITQSWVQQLCACVDIDDIDTDIFSHTNNVSQGTIY